MKQVTPFSIQVLLTVMFVLTVLTMCSSPNRSIMTVPVRGIYDRSHKSTGGRVVQCPGYVKTAKEIRIDFADTYTVLQRTPGGFKSTFPEHTTDYPQDKPFYFIAEETYEDLGGYIIESSVLICYRADEIGAWVGEYVTTFDNATLAVEVEGIIVDEANVETGQISCGPDQYPRLLVYTTENGRIFKV